MKTNWVSSEHKELCRCIRVSHFSESQCVETDTQHCST